MTRWTILSFGVKPLDSIQGPGNVVRHLSGINHLHEHCTGFNTDYMLTASVEMIVRKRRTTVIKTSDARGNSLPHLQQY